MRRPLRKKSASNMSKVRSRRSRKNCPARASAPRRASRNPAVLPAAAAPRGRPHEVHWSRCERLILPIRKPARRKTTGFFDGKYLVEQRAFIHDGVPANQPALKRRVPFKARGPWSGRSFPEPATDGCEGGPEPALQDNDR